MSRARPLTLTLSPDGGEGIRASARDSRGLLIASTNSAQSKRDELDHRAAQRKLPSPPSGERDRVRGHLPANQRSVNETAVTKEKYQPPDYGKHRTCTPTTRTFARQLRKSSTDAEKRLWRLLRGRHFNQFKFRRQYACGNYFLDFYCTLAKLAVELDGGGHGFPDQRTKDEKRNRFLADQGIRVLRFWNHQVRNEIESVRFEIWYALMERTGRKQEIADYLPKPARIL